MKIAYLILAHIDAEHIARLTKKITQGTDNIAFIHVDLKSDIDKFKTALSDCSQYRLLENRTDIRWGGFSSIIATIALMREAAEYGKFDRYVILQGLEYPLRSNKQIEDFFSQHKDTEFMLAQNISHVSDVREKHKIRLCHMLDSKDKLAVRLIQKVNSLFIELKIIPHFKRNYVKDADKNKLDIYQGCAQFGLTDGAIRYILNFYDENPKFNKYFKTVYASDEAYFHTVIYNSHFASATPNGGAMPCTHHLTELENLTYFEYPSTVTLFKDRKDWEILKDKDFLFFRKASSESKELLDLIDSIHDQTEKDRSND